MSGELYWLKDERHCIEVESIPDPPTPGIVELSFVIKDERGNPIEGARVDVSVDHTDKTGMEMSGPATEQGDGKYAIDADFSMSGNWKMTIYVRNDVLDYKEEIDLKIKYVKCQNEFCPDLSRNALPRQSCEERHLIGKTAYFNIRQMALGL